MAAGGHSNMEHGLAVPLAREHPHENTRTRAPAREHPDAPQRPYHIWELIYEI